MDDSFWADVVNLIGLRKLSRTSRLPSEGITMMGLRRGGSWGNPRTTTPEWRALRLVILARDRGRCYKCGRPASEVDHVDGNHHNDQPTNLAAICTPCHARKSSAEGHAARKLKAEAGRRPPEQHPGMVTSTAVAHLLGCTEPCTCGAWDRSTQPPPPAA